MPLALTKRMSRLLLVSNRLPVTVNQDGEKIAVAQSAGGLATGLKGPHEQSGGQWIGWPGDISKFSESQRQQVRQQLDALRCVPVDLSQQEVNRYYEGFSNRVLWPMFHYLLDRIPLHSRDWETYRQVNEKFADLTAKHYQEGDLIWVHDYQLLLVPGMLRQRLPDARIGFFLHIPFPSSEIFRTLPWRSELLEGMLGADVVGFHTLSYARHFANCLLRVLGVPTEVDRVKYRGREIRLGAFPMGIDAQAFATCAESEEVQGLVQSIKKRAEGHKILLGVDRLDYTKGIPRRLLAVERVLDRNPSLRGKLRMVGFDNPGGLQKSGAGNFALANGVNIVPDTTSRFSQGTVEKSNVRSVVEMTRMIEITRTYTQVANMIQAQADLSRSAVDKLAEVPN